MSPGYPETVATSKGAVIRPATPADATAIAAVRRASWFAAYDGIMDRATIDRATASGGHAADPPPYRRTFVAVAAPESVPSGAWTASARGAHGYGNDRVAAGAVSGEPLVVVGYASCGPERVVPTAIPPRPPLPGSQAGASPWPFTGELTAAGVAGETGELYAIYLHPDWWSAGVGRALTETVLTTLREAGYRRVVLWTLTGNVRARRFYERAGFTPDGTTNVLTGLGGVEELRYTRDLLP